MQFIKVVGLCFISVLMVSVSRAELIEYSRDIQPIFDNRCVACHSCFNAPCQLNLQSYEAFQRGATKLNVYNGTRLKSVKPSRMWIDAHGITEWRKAGFFTLNTSPQVDKNAFFSYLKLRLDSPQTPISKQVADSVVCSDVASTAPDLGMPYGLPPLSGQEMAQIKKWIEGGAQGPHSLSDQEIRKKSASHGDLLAWETFLNASDLKQKLVSRYLYEHLFLAHVHFSSQTPEFFRLVRSKVACEKGPVEIATRRPNDSPKAKNFFYCFAPLKGTIAMKTHIPLELGSEKLKRYKEIFYTEDWKVGKVPSYEPGVAENPFIAFQDIPVKARYDFLLEDAHYQISTFIKGPVCNGSSAVNSIQEQFYVYFLNPSSDNMVRSAEFAKKAENLLVLPGVFGSDAKVTEAGPLYRQLIAHREKYRKARTEYLERSRPEGYNLEDIWDGNQNNPNASLTVFRHDDNAVVLKGAVGDLSKTVFVLDYAIFERLVYNLVVNFDVFGNVSHQLLTRVYMDMIRMEAEELFLMFLPPEQRLTYRRAWYQGLLAKAKMTYVFPTMGSKEPTAIRFNDDGKETKKQMVEKILFYRLNEKTRGNLDYTNWKVLNIPDSIKAKPSKDKVREALHRIAAVKADDSSPFARFFPDAAYLKVTDAKGHLRVFSLVHNKEHENISWIFAESLRMAPKEDTLTIFEGYASPYPNMIFDVTEKELSSFVDQVAKIKRVEDYQKLVSNFGVRRSNETFWVHYDDLITHFKKNEPIQFGYLDLTRYELK